MVAAQDLDWHRLVAGPIGSENRFTLSVTGILRHPDGIV